MFKKISTAALIAALAALMTAALVSADASPIGKKHADQHRMDQHRMLIGKILEIGESQFTVEALNGEFRTIAVTDETIFRTRGEEGGEGGEASFSDLAAGMYVGVYDRESGSGEFSARLVALLPEDFDPADLIGQRILGEVSMVTAGGGFFKLDTRAGDALTISVDENTRFAGGLESLEDLEKGAKVGVLAQKLEDDTLLAMAVLGSQFEPPPFDKQGGKLSSIDGQQITITSRDEQTYTFTVTEETRFASRGGEVQGLEDLELDMILMVVFDSGSGENIARAVMVGDGALLELERVGGGVHNTANDKLTITTGDETLTFAVDEDTRIRGREIDSLDDLEKGMKVFVLYQVQEDGTLLAKGILVGRLFDRP